MQPKEPPVRYRLPASLCLGIVIALAALPSAQAEIFEDIVAWVNGAIITKSEYDAEEKVVTAEAYRQYTGKELDQQLARLREGLLLQMIDRKILVDRAHRLYDMKKMEESFYESVKEQQNIKSDEEFGRMLAEEGLTIPEFKQRLVEMFAPEEVLRAELKSRLGLADRQIEAYYQENPEDFTLDADVTFREIVLLVEPGPARERRRAELEALRQRLIAGEDFAEVAKQSSEAGSREVGGLVGPLLRKEMAGEIAAAVFSVPLAEVSEIVESPHGLHLFRVEARNDVRVRPLEEVRDSLRRALEERKYREELRGFIDKARDEAEWCVKTRYRSLLSIPLPPSCSGT